MGGLKTSPMSNPAQHPSLSSGFVVVVVLLFYHCIMTFRCADPRRVGIKPREKKREAVNGLICAFPRQRRLLLHQTRGNERRGCAEFQNHLVR